MADPRIRLATTKDAAGLLAIDSVTAQLPELEQLLRASIDSGSCWVAEGETLLGYVLLDYTFYGNGFVPLLFVDGRCRRRGIGERLLLHAVSTCRTIKCFTSTNESNNAMRQLLKKTGFESSGVIDNLDEGDPELVFVKRL